MKTTKSQLLSALQKVMPGIEKGNHFLEGSDAFLFDYNYLYSYNDSISVSTKFESEITASVKASDFFKLVMKLPDGEIDLEFDKEKGIINIKSGRTKAKIKTSETGIGQYIDGMNLSELSWKPISEQFFQALKLMKLTMSNCPYRGLFVNENLISTTDAVRVNIYKMIEPMDGFWIDDPIMHQLMGFPEELVGYSISPAWVHFKGKNDTIFSGKRNQDNSYPLTAIKGFDTDFQLQKTDIRNTLPVNFKEVADRIGVMAEGVDKFSVISLRIKKDELIIYSEKDNGSIEETLNWAVPFDQDIDLTIRADVSFLVEAGERCPAFFIRQAEGTSPRVVFYSENYKQIIATLSEKK